MVGELPVEYFDAVAEALGDTPFTVISTHLLRRRLCRAYISGAPDRFSALVLHPIDDPSEPASFGDDAQAIWQLLRDMTGWTSIETSQSCAPTLGALLEQELRVPVRYLEDVHHTLTNPTPGITHPAVRLLTDRGMALVEALQPKLSRPQIMWTLTHGAMAGAVIDGHVVSLAQTDALSEGYCDIGVFTHVAYRQRGYSTACAALVTRTMQDRGFIPVWSTGTHNHASLCVAAKIGFREVGRMTYVVPIH